MESTEYTASIPSEAPRVCPMNALTELKGGMRVSEDTPDGFPFGSVVAGSACAMYIDIVYGSGCQPGRGYGLTHGKERPVSVGGTSCLVVGFIGIGVTAEFTIRSFNQGFFRLKNKVSGSFSQV